MGFAASSTVSSPGNSRAQLLHFSLHRYRRLEILTLCTLLGCLDGQSHLMAILIISATGKPNWTVDMARSPQ